MRNGCRELAGGLQQAGAAVNLAGSLDDQVRQRRVQRIARDQLHGCLDGRRGFGRQVVGQIERAHRHVELAQEREAAHVGFRLREVQEPDIGRADHFRRELGPRGISGQEDRVDLAGQ